MTDENFSIPPHWPKPPFGPKLPKNWGVIVGVVVLLAAGIVFGYWQGKHRTPVQPENGLLPIVSINDPKDYLPAVDDVDVTGETFPPLSQAPDPFSSQSCSNRAGVVAGQSGQVTWSDPKLIATNTLFGGTKAENSYGGDYAYSLGRFTDGKYKGSDLLLGLKISNGEMGDGHYWYYIVRQGANHILLTKYSDPIDQNDYYNNIKPAVAFTEDKDFDLPDLNFPATLHSENPKAYFKPALSMGSFKNGASFFCADNLIKVFTDHAMGDVYTDIPNAQNKSFSNGFYLKSADGKKRAYELIIPFVGKDNVPTLTFLSGKKNTQEYSYKAIGGCGASQFMDVWDVKIDDLLKVGATVDGQPVYSYKDVQTKELKDTYAEIYVPEGQSKPSYAAFMAEHPIIFWKNPFGQFVRFKSMKYQPMAECAKPVIYLYPQKNQEVSVKIEPQGGMTVSDPVYKRGWNVIADPNSNITNLADGKVYPYLFWEGRGGMYETPKKGFVVAQKDVHQFLIDKLGQLGLNNKESGDFMEFWEPKMQSAPYYFVTFMGNDVMEALAPLTVSPKPDTVIRILMDFMPLESPVKVEAYNIRTPERKGFTVVEWGGVLRSEQK